MARPKKDENVSTNPVATKDEVKANNPAEPNHTPNSQLEAQNKALAQNQKELEAARAEFEAEKAKLEADRKKFDETKAASQKSDEESDKERSARIAKERKSAIKSRDDLSDKEKQILEMHDQGVQAFAIAKKVYEFVNNDTVGKVILTIRKEHADDFSDVEDVNSTKGYSGV